MKVISVLLVLISVSIWSTSAVNLYCSEKFVMTAVGTHHSLGLLANGTLISWGYNKYGELGLGYASEFEMNPSVVKPGSKWKYIAAGSSQAYGIMENGSLWGFGKGNLGDGMGLGWIDIPVQIGNDTDWSMIACGSDNTLALKKNGSLYSWGSNIFGEVGNGSKEKVFTPIAILSGEKWTHISVGEGSSFAIHANGSLYSWGNNWHGELGDNDGRGRRHKSVPTHVAQGIKWKTITANFVYVLAVDIDGNLYTWGGAGSGERGDLNRGDYYSWTDIPTPVLQGFKFKTVQPGLVVSLGILTNGSLVGWGYNREGVIGNGTKERIQFNPVIVGAHLAPWKEISFSWEHAVALSADGHLYTWGINQAGKLGYGSMLNSTLPQVCGGNDVCYAGKCAPWCPEGFRNETGFCVSKSTNSMRMLTQQIAKMLRW